MNKPLEEAIISLLLNYRFYGELVQLMNKTYTKEVPIAGVSVTNRINLYINPDTFNQLSLDMRVGVLLHEIKHVTEFHIDRSKKVAKSFNKALNVAADRAINEWIHVVTKNKKLIASIPDQFTIDIDGKSEDFKPVTKKNFQDMYPDKTILDNESMEYYYQFLKDNAKTGANGENDFEGDMDLMDDHGKWEESNDSSEMTKEVVRNSLNKAQRAAGAGNTPGDMSQLIEELNKATVNWRSVLQRFVARCVESTIDSSRKKISRRFGIIHPGTIREPLLKLGIAVDTSGSVSDAYLKQFFSEMKKINEQGIEIFLVQADMQVTSAKKYNPKEKIEVKGRGGTLFQPAIDELERVECDAIIYFTDGETFSETPVSKKPLLWALCPSYTIPTGWTEKNTIKITLPEGSNE